MNIVEKNTEPPLLYKQTHTQLVEHDMRVYPRYRYDQQSVALLIDFCHMGDLLYELAMLSQDQK